MSEDDTRTVVERDGAILRFTVIMHSPEVAQRGIAIVRETIGGGATRLRVTFENVTVGKDEP